MKEGFIVMGILLGYLASSQFIDSVGGWRYMYGLSLLPAILLGAGMVGPTVPDLTYIHHSFLIPAGVLPAVLVGTGMVGPTQPDIVNSFLIPANAF